MDNNKKNNLKGSTEISTFYIGDAAVGINILNIQEISKQFDITKIPRSFDYIEGVINLRGRIVTVLRPGKILGLPTLKGGEDNRVVIVDSKGEYIGLIVDKIGDVLPFDENDIEAPPANIGNIRGKYFLGVLRRKGQLIGIFDIDEVIGE